LAVILVGPAAGHFWQIRPEPDCDILVISDQLTDEKYEEGEGICLTVCL